MIENAANKIINSLLSEYGIIGIGFLMMAGALVYIGRYYLRIILPQQREDNKEMYNRTMEAAEKRDAMIQKSIDNQEKTSNDIRTLISETGMIQQQICKTIEKITDSIVDVNITFSAHNEKCNSILNATEQNSKKMDETIKTNAAIENEVKTINKNIDDLTDGVNKTFQAVNEIKCMLPNICKK